MIVLSSLTPPLSAEVASPRVLQGVGALTGAAHPIPERGAIQVAWARHEDEVRQAQAEMQSSMAEVQTALTTTAAEMRQAFTANSNAEQAAPSYRHPGKNWRVKRAARPAWYKAQTGTRRYVQSGSARVARFRPKNYR